MAEPTFTIHDRANEATVKGTLVPMLQDTEDITIGGRLNQGMSTVQVRLGVDPSTVMNLGDIVEIKRGDGSLLGKWKYERRNAATEVDDTWTVELLPPALELQEVDFTGNYTANPQTLPVKLAPLGAVTFDVPVAAALLRTKHCHAVHLTHDGHQYTQLYQARSRAADTLKKAVDLGGVGWWWFIDGYGGTELQNTPRATRQITADMVIWRHPTERLDNVFNVQPLDGGQVIDVNGFPVVLQSQREINAGPYGIAQLGRRVAQTIQDATLKVQGDLDHLGDMLLARAQIPLYEETLRLNASAPWCYSGDAVTLHDAGGAVIGTWTVTAHAQELYSGCQNLTIASEFGAFAGNPNAGVASWLNMGPPTPAALTGGGGGGAGGGYALLAEAHDVSPVLPVLNFTLNSGGIPVRITSQGSILVASVPFGQWATLSHSGLPAGMVDAQPKRISAGVWTPFVHTAVSRFGAAPDGTFAVGLVVGNVASTYDLVWDMYADVYAVGMVGDLTLTALTPSTGPSAGGTAVTITGSGFTTTTRVYFGDMEAAFVVVSDTELTCVSPFGPVGVVSVIVGNPTGFTGVGLESEFTYT